MNRLVPVVLVVCALAGFAAGQAPAPIPGALPGPQGWAGERIEGQERALIQASRKAGDRRMASYEIPADVLRDASGKVIRGWDFTHVWLGKHYPTYRQEIGDCVSMGTSNALVYTMAAQFCARPVEGKQFGPVFQPYIYGISRVQIGERRLGRGDGSVVAWAIKGIEDERYGILRSDLPGVPPYKGSLASSWGYQGPPQAMIDLAKGQTAEGRYVTTWEQSITCMAQGYFLVNGSNLAFSHRAREKDGRVWNERNPRDSWAHATAIIGYDDREGSQAVYYLNSWGEEAHAPRELYKKCEDATPGGFWIPRADFERILKQEATYAVSFNGFQARPMTAWLKPFPLVPEFGASHDSRDPRLPTARSGPRPASVGKSPVSDR